MADENEKLLMTLLKKSGNKMCADCGSKCKWFKWLFFPIKSSKHLLVKVLSYKKLMMKMCAVY